MNHRCDIGPLPVQFAYVGAQIGVWSYLIQYMQHNVKDTSEKTAADHVFYSLLALTVGRAVSTFLLRFMPGVKLMGLFGLLNVGCMAVAIWVGGIVGTWAIVCSSFFMSLMFPTIFTIAIRGLDKDQTQLGSSLIVMSIIGGAVLTPIMGLTSDLISINAAYVVPMVAFAGVTVFAFFERKESDVALVPAGAAAAAAAAATGTGLPASGEDSADGSGKDYVVGDMDPSMSAAGRSKHVLKTGTLKKLGGKDKDKWQVRSRAIYIPLCRYALCTVGQNFLC